jgi:hypothetical protein
MGTFPRVTHPSATDTRRCPFDLHVLGLPPAFALSQDQTLKLERALIGWSLRKLTESAHLNSVSAVHVSSET